MKPNDIYSRNSDGSFFSPFRLDLDDMCQLILINFEKDSDEYYNVFELQQACNKSFEKFLSVIAYRRDGGCDVYFQKNYPFASQSSILNNPFFVESPLKHARFNISKTVLDVYFEFEDRFGRNIIVSVNEKKINEKCPFFLLAPIGIFTKYPESFPIYSLYNISFARQRHTRIQILINQKKHKPDKFPLPFDFSKNYMIRYSGDTFNIDWNKNFNGQLLPIHPEIGKNPFVNGICYELINNDGHHEIKSINTTNNSHTLCIHFSPPIPDILSIKNNLDLRGHFSITSDNSHGTINGVYYITRIKNELEMKILPKYGWNPHKKRIMLKLLFLFVRVFKNWPKSYTWNAKILFDSSNCPFMRSGWSRI